VLANNPGSKFNDGITVDREQRIQKLASLRQTDVIVVLENVHDPHNIGAVLRTCDSVGIPNVFVVYTEAQLTEDTLQKGLNSKACSGAKKWVKTCLFTSVEDCVHELRKRNVLILGTHLAEEAKPIYACDFTVPTAIVLGNEHEGISNEFLGHLDGNIFIPQVGMVKSLNISVACAVIVYELYRQREAIDKYNQSTLNNELYQHYKSMNR
jgi:tRNA (guanosine-2'-O-)-methyltransferase